MLIISIFLLENILFNTIKNKKMNNVLLIGEAGYVGIVITSHFLKVGHKVKVLDNLIYKKSRFNTALFRG